MNTDSRPNIVWIYCDELRTDALGCYGGAPPMTRTPHLDQLCADGVRFTSHFVNSPICVSSRVALHTGLYPESTGIYGNEAAWAHYPGPADLVTLPRALQARGYQTVDFGKEHAPRAMTLWGEHDATGARPADLIGNLDEAATRTLVRSPTLGVILAGTSPPERAYPPQHITDRAVAWLAESSGPFLLRVSYLQPHPPILAPAVHTEGCDDPSFDVEPTDTTGLSEFERRFIALGGGLDLSVRELRQIRMTYQAVVNWLDDQVGQVLGALDRLGLRDRTIVLFTSDHGAYLGEGGGFGKHTFAPQSHRVPLILSWPGTLPRGVVREDINEAVDLFPTLLDLAGVDAPATQGRRLFGEPPRRCVYATIGYGESGSHAFPNVGLGRFGEHGWPRRACVRTARYRLDRNVRIDGRTAAERDWDVFLAESTTDPAELRNRAGDPELATVQADLLEMLARHIAPARETDPDVVYGRRRTSTGSSYEELHGSGATSPTLGAPETDVPISEPPGGLMKFAVLGITHESNTFAPGRTGTDAFTVSRGAEIVDRYAGAQSILAGYLAACAECGVEAVPLLFADAVAGPTVAAEAYDALVGELLDGLASRDSWDGVLLALHGAAVTDHFPDADGETLRRVRRLVGPHTPICVTLDMHANISPAMVEHSDVLVTYRTNPHVDPRARAAEGARITFDLARKAVRPRQALEMVPGALNILRQKTDDEPMRTVLARLDEVLARPRVLTGSVAEGYPYADVPEMGLSVVVVTDDDADLARSYAREIAELAWSLRDQFDGVAMSATDALRHAWDAPRGPVLLLDVGDNIGGGAPGDSVVILRRALEMDARNLFTIVAAPEAVRTCQDAGIGAQVSVQFGAATDPGIGPPLRVSGRVRSIHDGKFEDPTPTHGGRRYFDSGPTAVLELADNVVVVLTSRVTMPASLVQMTSLGLRPDDFRVIIAKGVQSPLAGYAPIAAEILRVDTPGCAALDLSRLTYHRRRVPMYPFEPDTRYGPGRGEPGIGLSPAGATGEGS